MNRNLNKSGFTMVELLLSLGLFSMLLVGLLQLLDTSTDLWRRVESRRERTEISASFATRLERDLSTLEAGLEGDLLADWTLFDVDGDEIAGLALPRLRFVRRASQREVARLAELQAPETLEDESLLEVPDPNQRSRAERALIETAWILVPDTEKSFSGRLLRAERFLDDPDRVSLFDARMFTASGRPVVGLFEEVSSEVIWMDMAFATQATDTRLDPDGMNRWQAGQELVDGSASWDAWTRDRPDVELCDFNLAAQSMPKADDTPVLPRRVRVSFEVQTPDAAKRRTRLNDTIEHDAKTFLVLDGRRLPEPNQYVLVDEEWMQVQAIEGDRLTVKRGMRGTLKIPHQADTVLQYGWRTEVEVPIAGVREDWQ